MADEAAMIAHGDGHQGMFGHERKLKHHGGKKHKEHHYKDTYKDTYKDNYKDHYKDNYKDHYAEEEVEHGGTHHGGNGDEGSENESSDSHLKHKHADDGLWFKGHKHKEDFQHARFKQGGGGGVGEDHDKDNFEDDDYHNSDSDEKRHRTATKEKTGNSRHFVGTASGENQGHATNSNINDHRSGSESESLLNGWIGYNKDNDKDKNVYNAHFIESLLPKKLVSLENQRIGHKVNRETNEIYRLFHDMEKHNVKEPEQRLIGELSRLIASKWGLNGNLGYKVAYPHLPKGLTHKYRKIVVNLNEPGYPGETIEEPHVPISNHHHNEREEGKNHAADNQQRDHSQHHYVPVYHNHHLSHKRDGFHNPYNEEKGTKRNFLQKQQKRKPAYIPIKTPSSSQFELNSKAGSKRNLQLQDHPGPLFSDVTTSWQRAIPESAFPHRMDYVNFMRSLKDDWNTLENQSTVGNTHRRQMRRNNVGEIKKYKMKRRKVLHKINPGIYV